MSASSTPRRRSVCRTSNEELLDHQIIPLVDAYLAQTVEPGVDSSLKREDDDDDDNDAQQLELSTYKSSKDGQLHAWMIRMRRSHKLPLYLLLSFFFLYAITRHRHFSTAYNAVTGNGETRVAPPIFKGKYERLVVRPELEAYDPSIRVNLTRDPHSPGWKLTDDPSNLPPCTKMILFTFSSRSGFGAGISNMIRAALIAEYLNATFLIDSGRWPYGRYEFYFEPVPISCVPPFDWWVKQNSKYIGQKNWIGHKKIRIRAHDQAILDEIEAILNIRPYREDFLRLYKKEFSQNWLGRGGILPADENVPAPLLPSFEEHSRVARRLWKPVRPILHDMEVVKSMMEISKGGPTIGIHVRLGDKKNETAAMMKSSNMLNPIGNLTAYLEAAHEVYESILQPLEAETSLISKSISQLSQRLGLSPPPPPPPSHLRPTAVVVTAEEDVMRSIHRNKLGHPFQFERTPLKRLPKGSFTQQQFLNLSRGVKILHTRQLVRDITLMATQLDGAVVTGTSNIGRLVMLLGGTDAVLGPKNARGERVGPRIRSIDLWWFPTSWPKAIWTSIGIDQTLPYTYIRNESEPVIIKHPGQP